MNNSMLYQEGILSLLLPGIQRAVVQEGGGSDPKQSPGVSLPLPASVFDLTFICNDYLRKDTAFRLKTFTKVDFIKAVNE